MDIQTCFNLHQLIEEDQNIQLIEIWERVLYIRVKKGRNRFHSKKNITTLSEGIFVNPNNISSEYKQLQKKYHPDYNKKYENISKGINQWKELLSESGQRKFDRNLYIQLIELHGPLTSIFTIGATARNIFIETSGCIHIPSFSSKQEFIEWKAKDRSATEAFLDSQLTRAEIIKKYGKSYYDYERDLPF